VVALPYNSGKDYLLWDKYQKYIIGIDINLKASLLELCNLNQLTQIPILYEQKQIDDNCFFIAMGNLLSSCGILWDIKLAEKSWIKNKLNTNKSIIVSTNHLFDVTSALIKNSTAFLSKKDVELDNILNKRIYLVRSWQDIENLMISKPRIFLIYGFFKKTSTTKIKGEETMGHYLVINSYYFNGRGIIFDGCHKQHKPQRSISFAYNIEIARLFLEEPTLCYEFYPSEYTLNNLRILTRSTTI